MRILRILGKATLYIGAFLICALSLFVGLFEALANLSGKAGDPFWFGIVAAMVFAATFAYLVVKTNKWVTVYNKKYKQEEI